MNKKLIFVLISIFIGFSSQTQNIVSTIGEEIATPWEGFGYNQWGYPRESDGITFKSWDDALWNITSERILAVRPSLVRLPLMREWFHRDDTGKDLPVGTYNWNSKYMQAYFKIMDLYKENDIKVMSGLWHAIMDGYIENEFYESDDFAKIQGDLIEFLFKTKGYDKIITSYAPTNEPLGCGITYTRWSNMCKKLYAELQKRGLPTNLISGADSWGDWIWKPAEINKNELGAYDFHCYLNDTPDDTYDQLYNRKIEPNFENNIANIQKYDKSNKPVHVSEIAPIGVSFIDWPVSTAPAHCRIDTYEYAVGFMDYGIQLARSGMSSGLAWGLDGFDQNKNAGMWNNAGTYGGMTLRPWYYTWQLMCRYFPAGAKILKMSELDERKDLRILGARIGADDYSFAIVNRRMDKDSKTQNVTIKVPGGAKKLYVYYFNKNNCGNGIDLSIPYDVINTSNINSVGVTVEVPIETCMLITSLPPLEDSEKANVSSFIYNFESAERYNLIAQTFNGANISIVNNPRKVGINTSDKVCSISLLKEKGANYDISNSYGTIIPLDNVKITNNSRYLNFQTYTNYTLKSTIGICIEGDDGNDYLKGYTFDTKRREWEQLKLDLTSELGKNIKYVVIFPDRELEQSTSTDAYLSIDNLNLSGIAADAYPISDIVLNPIDKSVSKSLLIDFEYDYSYIVPSGDRAIYEIKTLSNPRNSVDNSSNKVLMVTMYSDSENDEPNKSKMSLNVNPFIEVTSETPNLFIKGYRPRNETSGIIELEFKSGLKFISNFRISQSREWLRIGFKLDEFIGDIITNLSIYPNISYAPDKLGVYDNTYFDNIMLSNDPVSSMESINVDDNVKVNYLNNKIIVTGANGSSINIFTIDGKVINSDIIKSDYSEIDVDKGLYFVRINNKTFKVSCN